MTFSASVSRPSMALERKFVLGLGVAVASGCIAFYAFGVMEMRVIAPLVLVCLGILASGVAHYSLFRPFRQLVSMARAIGAGDFSERLRFERRDEIGSLAHEMDSMCDRLESARRAAEDHLAALEQLRHSDRIATLGRLASSVAHELGNPLNVIELRAQLIRSGEVGTLPQAQLNAAVITEQAQRMTRIIDQILSFARMQPARLTRVDVVSVLNKAVSLTEHIAKQHKASVRIEAHRSSIELAGDADKLLQLIVNLVVNGVQATSEGGTLRVRTSELTRTAENDPDGMPQHYVCIDVIDQGPGIDATLLSKVFEPFFSTRSAEGGTGLGLPVAQGIAREHDGWIVATSEPRHGACFKVHIPLRSEEEAAASREFIHR